MKNISESRTQVKNKMSEFLSGLLNLNSGNGSFWDLILAIVAAYFGGVLSSLTPCVYPMIPITVSVVGGLGSHQGQTRPSWRGFLLRGSSYVFGMTVTYSFLGVLAGISGRVFGSFTQTSQWNLTLGVILSFSALVMMDVIPFDPVVWWDQVKRKIRGEGAHHSHLSSRTQEEMTLLGAFFLGASSGFIAAPCTTPVLTGILAYITKTQSIGVGFLLMMSFSLGLGTLLLLMGACTGAVQFLPRSGHWMKKIKTLSGIILLIFAEYLIYRAGNLTHFLGGL